MTILDDILIDPEDPKYRSLLDNLQGDIIKAHGRTHTASLFIQFTVDETQKETEEAPKETPKVREWISAYAHRYVTSTSQQIQQANRHRLSNEDGGLFGSFFLTSQGYNCFKLGDLPKEENKDKNKKRFEQGMRDPSVQDELDDPPVKDWEKGFQSKIHALALLADNDKTRLEEACAEVAASLSGIGTVLTTERGKRRLNAENEDIEAFGFRDGVSNPAFLKGDKHLGGRKAWDPAAPLKLVLVEDPNARQQDCYGSFLVFRKLEQDVRKFNEKVSALAKRLGLGENEELAGAYVVGRFKDGTPVTLSDTAKSVDQIDFNYAEDKKGSRCPFHAHIRKTNPRGDTVGPFVQKLDDEKMRRIVRRGQPYGEQGSDTSGGVGLLFLCFQSNIRSQFEFIQASWSNKHDFVKPGTGLDGISGHRAQQAEVKGQNWTRIYGKSDDTVTFDFSDVVKLKGGEYFFAPSIPFLQQLATVDSTR